MKEGFRLFRLAAAAKSPRLPPDNVSTSISEQLFETSDCQACIFHNSTHGDRIHRIVSRNRDEMRAVAHYNVLALAHNSEAGLFERLDRPEMINAGNFRHR